MSTNSPHGLAQLEYTSIEPCDPAVEFIKERKADLPRHTDPPKPLDCSYTNARQGEIGCGTLSGGVMKDEPPTVNTAAMGCRDSPGANSPRRRTSAKRRLVFCDASVPIHCWWDQLEGGSFSILVTDFERGAGMQLW